MASSRLLTKILANFLSGVYLLTLVLKHATTGISGEIIESFESDDAINVNVVMKDKSGDELLRIFSKANKI